MAKSKRPQKTNGFYKVSDPKEGLEVHRIKTNYLVSRYCYNMSVFDADNAYYGDQGHFAHRRVSIVTRARKCNKYKSHKINACRTAIDRED